MQFLRNKIAHFVILMFYLQVNSHLKIRFKKLFENLLLKSSSKFKTLITLSHQRNVLYTVILYWSYVVFFAFDCIVQYCILFHSNSIPIPFPFYSYSIPIPFPILFLFYFHFIPISLSFYSYFIHILFIFHSHSILILSIFPSYSIPLLFLFCSYSIPILLLFCPYSISIPFQFYSYSIHILFPFHFYSFPILCHSIPGAKVGGCLQRQLFSLMAADTDWRPT